MNIDRFSNNSNYSPQNNTTKKSSAVFSITTEHNENVSSKDPLAYYHELCKEFPNVSFRLDDRETALKDTSKPCFGYNGSTNQVGNNFGGIGQCSISIDVEVIRNMQKNPVYAENVRGMIRLVERTYPDIERDTRRLGMKYTIVRIEDENGELQRSALLSNMQASTEEELRRMWDMDQTTSQAKRIVEQAQNSLIEHFLAMTEKTSKNYTHLIDSFDTDSSNINSPLSNEKEQ